MSNNQFHIQTLQQIIRNLQHEIQVIQDIINQLRQEEDPNIIIIEAKPIFDNDDPIRFELPPSLLQQDTEATETSLPEPHLDNMSTLAVTNHPNQPSHESAFKRQGAEQESGLLNNTQLDPNLPWQPPLPIIPTWVWILGKLN